MSLPLTALPSPARAPSLLLRLYLPEQHRTLPHDAGMLLLLDEGERRRADGMESPSVRTAFVVGRYLQRRFVAELLGTDARRLIAAYSCPTCADRGLTHPDHGRPGYLLDGTPIPLRQSISRAEGAVLLAALPSDDELYVGVDLESVDAVGFDGFDDVALTPREKKLVGHLPERDRRLHRARLWARKEALVKALGTGFSHHAPGELDVLEDPRVTDAELPTPQVHEHSSSSPQEGSRTSGLVAAVALSPATT